MGLGEYINAVPELEAASQKQFLLVLRRIMLTKLRRDKNPSLWSQAKQFSHIDDKYFCVVKVRSDDSKVSRVTRNLVNVSKINSPEILMLNKVCQGSDWDVHIL